MKHRPKKRFQVTAGRGVGVEIGVEYTWRMECRQRLMSLSVSCTQPSPVPPQWHEWLQMAVVSKGGSVRCDCNSSLQQDSSRPRDTHPAGGREVEQPVQAAGRSAQHRQRRRAASRRF